MNLVTSNSSEYSHETGIERFGILHIIKRSLVYFRITENQGDGVRFTHRLELPESQSKEIAPLWLVDHPEHALWVLHHPTNWFNANYSSPSHSLSPEECAIVKVIQTQKIMAHNCSIPSDLGFYEQKYQNAPQQFAELKPHIEAGRCQYDLIDLCNDLQESNGTDPVSILDCRPAAL